MSDEIMNEITALSIIEKKYDWLKWVKEIPFISFRPEWKVRIIPPFNRAIVRFVVSDMTEKKWVSVYLDCYNHLGYYTDAEGHPKPYWEVYPVDGDTARCSMNDIKTLLKDIQRSLDEQEVNEKL